MANVKIDVAAEFKGKKAFDQAGKSVGGLEKGVEGLAKKFAGLFAAKKLIDFGKSSVKAFMEDQKSVALLANSVKNLGLAFETPAIEDFIGKLSRSAGIADEQLRPAMQSLITTTGSAAKSQELLTQAIDISRGSGVELSTVVQDLDNAYIGNTKGLKKYNLGLTQAELKTMGFAKVQDKLNQQFKGSNAAYLDTYAGKLDILKTAAGEAQETIGKNLVDSLALLGGDTSVQGLADSMSKFATFIGDAIYGLGTLISKLQDVNAAMPDWLKKLGGLAIKISPGGQTLDLLKKLSEYGANARNTATGASTIEDYNMTADAKAQALARKKAEAAAAKRAKELAALQTKQTKAVKEQALLKKQSSLFDLQQIEIIAALKGKLSEEDRKRAELQLAVLQGDTAQATILSAQIADSIDKTGKLKAYLTDFELKNDPFKAWMDSLEKIANKVSTISKDAQTLPQTTDTQGKTSPALPSTNSTTVGQYTYGYTGTGTGQGGSTYMDYLASHPAPIVVQFQGSDAVTNALRDSFVSSSMDGSFSQINRNVGAFDR
jgi:hypothetical protein